MESVRNVRLLAFAAARDLVGVAESELDLQERCVVAELWPRLVERHPALEPYRSAIRLAVNGTWASDDTPVSPGDEVALLPPVSGG